jgi:hypothetical protein
VRRRPSASARQARASQAPPPPSLAPRPRSASRRTRASPRTGSRSSPSPTRRCSFSPASFARQATCHMRRARADARPRRGNRPAASARCRAAPTPPSPPRARPATMRPYITAITAPAALPSRGERLPRSSWQDGARVEHGPALERRAAGRGGDQGGARPPPRTAGAHLHSTSAASFGSKPRARAHRRPAPVAVPQARIIALLTSSPAAAQHRASPPDRACAALVPTPAAATQSPVRNVEPPPAEERATEPRPAAAAGAAATPSPTPSPEKRAAGGLLARLAAAAVAQERSHGKGAAPPETSETAQ